MIDDDLEELWKEYRHLAAYTRHARLWLHEYDHDRLVRIADKVGALIEKLTRRQEVNDDRRAERQSRIRDHSVR